MKQSVLSLAVSALSLLAAACTGKKEYVIETTLANNFTAGYTLSLDQDLNRSHGAQVSWERINLRETRTTLPIPDEQSAEELTPVHYYPHSQEAPGEAVLPGTSVCYANNTSASILFGETGGSHLRLEETIGIGWYSACSPAAGTSYVDGVFRTGMEIGTSGDVQGDFSFLFGIGPRAKLGPVFLQTLLDIYAPVNRKDSNIAGMSVTAGASF